MTDAERQALQDEHAACLARAADIIAALTNGSASGPNAQTAAEWPLFADDDDLKTPGELACRFRVDPSTIRRWSEEYGIGKRYGGRWRVSIKRLKAHLAA